MLDILFRKLMDRRSQAPPPPAFEPPKPARQRESPRLPDSALVQLEWLDENDEFRRIQANVHDRSRRGFSLWLNQKLSVGWPVAIAHRTTVYRGVVRHCREVDGRWQTGFQVVDDERRRDDRYPFRCDAEMSWQAGVETRRVKCEIFDANGGGVQIELEEELPAGVAACLYYDGWRRFGSTVWSKAKDGVYRAGIHFTGEAISDESVDYKG